MGDNCKPAAPGGRGRGCCEKSCEALGSEILVLFSSEQRNVSEIES